MVRARELTDFGVSLGIEMVGQEVPQMGDGADGSSDGATEFSFQSSEGVLVRRGLS